MNELIAGRNDCRMSGQLDVWTAGRGGLMDDLTDG